MERETKRCPYCGEEILAVAKKCKHCGEWLDQTPKATHPEPSPSESDSPTTSKNSTAPLSGNISNAEGASETSSESRNDVAEESQYLEEDNRPPKVTIGIFSALALLFFIVFLILRCGGNNASNMSSDTDMSNDSVATDTYSQDSDGVSEMSMTTNSSDYEEPGIDDEADMFSFNNPWNVEHFHDDWGEDVGSYITTTLESSGWNIKVDYIPGDSQTPDGVFRFSLTDENGHLKDMYGPAQILVRLPNGKSFQIEVTGVRSSLAFVENPDCVKALKLLFNYGKIDILMKYEMYNERHQSQATFDSTEGYFNRAVNTFL